ncbi:MAG: hypothetical protein V4773_21425 [Verrucomicrobiota bacterium]
MNSSDAERERFVLPQWLPFKVAANDRQLSATNNEAPITQTRASEEAFFAARATFWENPSPFIAGDLLGIALRLGQTAEAKKLAEYVLTQPIAGPIALHIAGETLGIRSGGVSASLPLQSKIREAKAWLRRFPNDAIAWVEHARLYTIIGQKRKAEQVMERGLALAPFDRYIVRAAVRFFIHRGNWDRAHEIAGHAAKRTNDPWISALWVSTGSQRGTVPSAFKSLFLSALNAREPFHFAELLEACATEEVITGSEKKAKRAFQQAWIEPPKTVVTHSQWVLREKLPALATTASIDFSQSAEAMAWISLMRMDLLGAVQSSREWALEEPYSSNAFLHGSFVDTLREEYTEAEMLAREGLRANPGHHGLTNNLAFALVGQNLMGEAAIVMEPLRNEIDRNTDVALVATWGLLRMKQGAHAEGRGFYVRAIEKAKEQKDPALVLRVVLNYLTAEMDSGGTVDPVLLSSSADALAKTSDARIIATAERLNKRFYANQSLFPNAQEKESLARFDKAVKQSSAELKGLVFAAQKSLPKETDKPAAS